MADGTSLGGAQAGQASRWALWLLLAFYVAFQLTHAWLLDDTYITLRTVDNFVNGLGLRWNPEERVQTYTHPLWMFALCGVRLITEDSFYGTLAFSFVTSLAALFVALRSPTLRARAFRPILFMAVLLGSKCFTEYSSSGLENPLTHLLLALFFTRWLDERTERPRDRRELGLLVALAFVNRMDTILLFVGPMVWLAWEERARLRSLVRELAVTSTPAVAWVLFALLYYGTIIPNTAVAKVYGARVTQAERLQAGLAHVIDSLVHDPLSLIACGLAVTVAVASRKPRVSAAAMGIVLYVLYVVVAGGIGTHMSGRFFSAPLFLSAILLAHLAMDARIALGAVAAALVWMVGSPVSQLQVGFASYTFSKIDRGVLDVRRFVEEEGATLLNVMPGEEMPRHPWYRAGQAYRDEPERVRIGGLSTGPYAMGYGPFAAGPDHFFIDPAGLTDPLIARLPLPIDMPVRPGHLVRIIPAGYPQSVELDENLIDDEDLHQYYEVIRLLTRGPIFSWQRLSTIVQFNLGAYEPLIDAYAERNGLRPKEPVED